MVRSIRLLGLSLPHSPFNCFAVFPFKPSLTETLLLLLLPPRPQEFWWWKCLDCAQEAWDSTVATGTLALSFSYAARMPLRRRRRRRTTSKNTSGVFPNQAVVGGRSVEFAEDEGPAPLNCTSCLDSMAHDVAPEYTNGFTCDESKVHHRRNPAHWYCRGPTCDVDICTGCAEKLRIEFAMLTTTPAPLRSGNGALRDLSDEFDAVGDECRGEDIDDAEIDNEDEVQHDSMHAVVSDVETSEAAARREYLAILCGRPKISRGERADILAGLLVARLRRHVLRRIPSNNGARDHEVLMREIFLQWQHFSLCAILCSTISR